MAKSFVARQSELQMDRDKEREKAKQKNIAVIENAIAARNKVLMLLLLCSFLFT